MSESVSNTIVSVCVSVCFSAFELYYTQFCCFCFAFRLTIIIRLRRAVVVVVAIVPVTVVVVLIVLCICFSTYVVRCISIVYLAPIRFHAYLVVLIGPVELNWHFVAPFSRETKAVHSLGSIN